MAIPFFKEMRIGGYMMKQKLLGRKRYPLVLMLEPLFRCNLACAGCGKIDYPAEILNQRLSYDDCMAAIEECGAPAVSIAGGEPLLHRDMPRIVEGFVARKKFVILCTNALLLAKKIDQYKPSPYLSWSIHLDGDQVMHDKSVCQTGVYKIAVDAIKLARSKGFRVQINCTLFEGADPEQVARFFDEMTALGIDGITVSPGYSYERAPDQNGFLNRTKTKTLFREIFKRGRGGTRIDEHDAWMAVLDLLNPGNFTGNPYSGSDNPDFFANRSGCNLIAEGFWPSVHEVPPESEIKQAEKARDSRFRYLTREALRLAAVSTKELNEFLQQWPDTHLAMDALGLSANWHTANDVRVACTNCGDAIKQGLAFHKSSVTDRICVVDPMKAYKAKAITRDEYEELTGEKLPGRRASAE